MKDSYTTVLATVLALGVLFLALAMGRSTGLFNRGGLQVLSNATPSMTHAHSEHTSVASMDESAVLGLEPLDTPDPSATEVTPSGTMAALYSAAEAVSHTLETQFPSGFAPTYIQTRLISYSTFMEEFMALGPEDYEDSIGPVWLVGILADGLTNDDVIPRGFPSGTLSPPSSVPGAFYAWDGNGSFLVGYGALNNTGTESMANILSMMNENLTIVTATGLPSVLVSTDTPTP